METIVTEIDRAILEGRKVYVLHNGVQIELPKKDLKGDTVKKRLIESRTIAERLYNDVKQLKLI